MWPNSDVDNFSGRRAQPLELCARLERAGRRRPDRPSGCDAPSVKTRDGPLQLGVQHRRLGGIGEDVGVLGLDPEERREKPRRRPAGQYLRPDLADGVALLERGKGDPFVDPVP
jgi:hypothetical protein